MRERSGMAERDDCSLREAIGKKGVISAGRAC
jgi:hypothetical protein